MKKLLLLVASVAIAFSCSKDVDIPEASDMETKAMRSSYIMPKLELHRYGFWIWRVDIYSSNYGGLLTDKLELIDFNMYGEGMQITFTTDYSLVDAYLSNPNKDPDLPYVWIPGGTCEGYDSFYPNNDPYYPYIFEISQDPFDYMDRSPWWVFDNFRFRVTEPNGTTYYTQYPIPNAAYDWDRDFAEFTFATTPSNYFVMSYRGKVYY